MANITINEKKNTLEITKKFAAAAAKFGSDEYRELKEARSDFPAFKVVVKSTKSRSSFKGLTYEYMERYIKAHPNAEININEYNSNKEALECYAAARAYNEMKKWFLEKYPEVAKFAA